jgi:hypothetical protein
VADAGAALTEGSGFSLQVQQPLDDATTGTFGVTVEVEELVRPPDGGNHGGAAAIPARLLDQCGDQTLDQCSIVCRRLTECASGQHALTGWC